MDEKRIATAYGNISEACNSVGLGIFTAGIFVAILTPSWQAYEWLRNGRWPSLTIQDGFKYAEIRWSSVSWIGVQSIIDWMMMQSLTVGLFVLCMMFAVPFAWIGHHFEAEKRVLETRRTYHKAPDPAD